MKLLAQLISLLALAGTVGLPVLFFLDQMPLPRVQSLMLAAAVAWFIATPFWMEQAKN